MSLAHLESHRRRADAYTHNDIVSQDLYRTHPEYFGLVKGKRVEPGPRVPWQPCLSNPDVIRIASEMAGSQFRESAGLRSFSLSGRDNTAFCECAGCRAQPGNVSDRGSPRQSGASDFDRRHPIRGRKICFSILLG